AAQTARPRAGAEGVRVRPRPAPRSRGRAGAVRLVPSVAAEHVHGQADRGALRRRAGGDQPPPRPPGARGAEGLLIDYRRRATTIAAAAALAVAWAAMAPAEVKTTSFKSAALGRDVACAVHLPPSYAA